MTGIDEMELKFRKKINNVIGDNVVLKRYNNYISSTSSIRTQYTYICIVSAFLKHVNKNESELSFDDFNDYLSNIKYFDNQKTKTSSYVITVYSALKKFSEYLSASGKINKNYMLDIKRPKAIEKQTTIQKRNSGFLTEKEIHKLIKNIYNNPSKKRELADEWKVRNCAIIYLFLYTGIRCSALVSINLNDLDLQKRILYVTDKGSQTKEINLSEKLCSILSEWINERNKIGIDNDALFVSNRKQRISTQAVALMVETYTKQSGITNKNITPHKLRATYGTQLYNRTGDIHFVQECMGHSSPSTTQLYIRGNHENSKRAAEIMSSII